EWALDKPRRKVGLVWAGVPVAAMVIILGAFLWRSMRPSSASQPLVRMDVDLGSNVTLGSITGADQILSPDGTRLIYVAQGKLWSRTLDQAEALELAATDGAFAPFFSPDGKWVGFFAQG